MIQSIRLKNYRSYSDDSFEFSSSVNIIVGPNAIGKTNLLEAILVLGRGNSYRAADYELVKFDSDWARLDAGLGGSERTIKITNVPSRSKTYEIDGKIFKRLRFDQKIPIVLFEPDHLRLLSGSPERRRLYLDELLEQIKPGYGTTIQAYKRVLAQRNSLLKKGQSHASTQLFPWNIRLSELAGVIVKERSELVTVINIDLAKLYSKLSGTKTKLEAVYKHKFSPANYESLMLQKLETSLADDLARGYTGVGPHREDFEVQIGGHPADVTASRGESRTLILALKIIEMKIKEGLSEQAPLLLLDDVFSELDGNRRRALTSFLQPYQTFITTTDADMVVKHFTENTQIIPLAKNLL